MQNLIPPVITNAMRGPWRIDASYAISELLPLAFQFIQQHGAGSGASDQKKELKYKPEAVVFGAAGPSARHDLKDAPAGSVAIIPIKGALIRENSYPNTGMQQLLAWTQEAHQNPNVTAVIFDVNSGGGSVDFTDVFRAGISALSTDKPTVAFTDGYMCSAAYELASACDLIIIGSEATIIGSIGTQSSVTGNAKMLEKLGLELFTYRASESPDKNEAFLQAQLGKGELIKAEILDPMNDVFLQAVQASRPQLVTDKKSPNYAMSGKVFIGRKAIELGLADEFGNMNHAISSAIKLADTKKPSTKTNSKSNTNPNPNMKKFFQAAWTFTMATLGIDPAAAATTEVTADHFDALATKFEAVQTELATAKADLKAEQEAHAKATQTATDLQTSLTAMTKERDDAKAEAVKFGAQPGATTTTPVKTTAEKQETAPADKTAAQVVASLPHNAAVLDNPLFAYTPPAK